jgi:hypothetical protein
MRVCRIRCSPALRRDAPAATTAASCPRWVRFRRLLPHGVGLTRADWLHGRADSVGLTRFHLRPLDPQVPATRERARPGECILALLTRRFTELGRSWTDLHGVDKDAHKGAHCVPPLGACRSQGEQLTVTDLGLGEDLLAIRLGRYGRATRSNRETGHVAANG